MTILIAAEFTEPEWQAWQNALSQALPGEQWLRWREGAVPDQADIALVANPPSGALAGLPNLRLIQSLWAGVDRLLADTSLPSDVPLARMVDPAMSQAMAQTVVWAVLGLQRDFLRYAAQQRSQHWQAWPQRRADETTVLVLGLGQMGRCAAQRLLGMGYRVLGWSSRPQRIDGIVAQSGAAALHGLLSQAQIVVNLLPLTPATCGLFDAERLAWLPRGASLVNLARGAHVVDADLLAALDNGHVQHAVLDVFHAEPLPAGHRYWSHSQVTVLPHVAAQTDPRSAAHIVARNVRALRQGLPLEHLVDRGRAY